MRSAANVSQQIRRKPEMDKTLPPERSFYKHTLETNNLYTQDTDVVNKLRAYLTRIALEIETGRAYRIEGKVDL